MQNEKKSMQTGIAENLKKGITELLILSFLDKNDMHIYAIINQLDKQSGGVCKIAYPYAAIYRLMNKKYIEEIGKKVDENRLRQFYHLTDEGREYLHIMKAEYEEFMGGVNRIFSTI